MPWFRSLAFSAGLLLLSAVGRADDAKLLEGTWKLTSAVVDGKATTPNPADRLTIAGNQMTLKSGEEVRFTAAIKLEPTSNPKGLEMTYTAGPNKGKVFKAIYAIEGDTIKFCRPGKSEDPRPKEFASAAGSGAISSVYSRVK